MIKKIENENKNLLCGKNQSKECVCVYIYMHALVYVCVYTYIYTYIYMYLNVRLIKDIKEHIFNENI